MKTGVPECVTCIVMPLWEFDGVRVRACACIVMCVCLRFITGDADVGSSVGILTEEEPEDLYAINLVKPSAPLMATLSSVTN